MTSTSHSRAARGATRLAAVLGLALAGALFLAPAAGAAPRAVPADLSEVAAPATIVTIPPASVPPLTIPPRHPGDDLPDAPPVAPDDLTDCPESAQEGDGCDKPERPCDFNGDGKETIEDWILLRRGPTPGDCRPPKPPCDANGDGEKTIHDWLYLREHPGACQQEPPCDANGDGKLDQADLRHLKRYPDACEPPATTNPPPFRPPTRIDTGAGGSAGRGPSLGQLALAGAVLAALAGGIATLPRRVDGSSR